MRRRTLTHQVTESDRRALAERIRWLLSSLADGTLESAAAALHVPVLSLRMSIDERSPHPTLEVILAAIEHFAVDPGWLLTGEYSAHTHRSALGVVDAVQGDRRRNHELRALIRSLATPGAILDDVDPGPPRRLPS